jgi:hypothetical protein
MFYIWEYQQKIKTFKFMWFRVGKHPVSKHTFHDGVLVCRYCDWTSWLTCRGNVDKYDNVFVSHFRRYYINQIRYFIKGCFLLACVDKC